MPDDLRVPWTYFYAYRSQNMSSSEPFSLPNLPYIVGGGVTLITTALVVKKLRGSKKYDTRVFLLNICGG